MEMMILTSGFHPRFFNSSTENSIFFAYGRNSVSPLDTVWGLYLMQALRCVGSGWRGLTDFQSQGLPFQRLLVRRGGRSRLRSHSILTTLSGLVGLIPIPAFSSLIFSEFRFFGFSKEESLDSITSVKSSIQSVSPLLNNYVFSTSALTFSFLSIIITCLALDAIPLSSKNHLKLSEIFFLFQSYFS